MGFFDIESGPSARFNTVGDSVTGTITKPYSERQATEFGTDRGKVDERGNPVMMAVVELQTDERDPSIGNDDGTRVLYCEKYAMKLAIAKALQQAGAPDLQPGGVLTVTYTGDQASTKGFAQKLFHAEYTAPAKSFGGVSLPAAPAAAPQTASNGVVGDDLVAAARAAQQAAQAGQAAMLAKSAAPAEPAANGAGGDMLKIRELSKLGFSASEIHAALPAYGMDAITAVLSV